MPILMCPKEAEGHKIPICCDEEMKVAGRWYHCFKCGMLPHDIIVTPKGKYKVIDVGNFERI